MSRQVVGLAPIRLLQCRRLAPISAPFALRLQIRHNTNQPSSATDTKLLRKPSAPFYTGPLARTFRSLKLFSLSSLALSTAMAPIFFLIESPMPTAARAALAFGALGTSAFSTALVGWLGGPYVSSMRRVPITKTNGEEEGEAIEFKTKSLFLRDLNTTVFDTAFLTQTGRPFAKWELAREMEAQVDESRVGRKEGEEEVIAQTCDSKGVVKGEWKVRWKAIGDGGMLQGVGFGKGKVVRSVLTFIELMFSCIDDDRQLDISTSTKSCYRVQWKFGGIASVSRVETVVIYNSQEHSMHSTLDYPRGIDILPHLHQCNQHDPKTKRERSQKTKTRTVT
jgi:hypothetical protein